MRPPTHSMKSAIAPKPQSMQAEQTRRPEWTTFASAVAAGLFVALVAGFAISSMEMRYGANPMTSSGSSLVPISAVAVGTIAVSVFVVTMNTMGLRPNRWIHLLSGLLIGTATVLFSHRFCYQHVMVDGRPVSDALGFGTYLKSMLTNCEVPFGPALDGIPFGNLGYLRAAVQVAAFAIGGWAIAPYVRLGTPAPALAPVTEA